LNNNTKGLNISNFNLLTSDDNLTDITSI